MTHPFTPSRETPGDPSEILLARAGLTAQMVRDLPISEIRSRIDAYRASVGKITTAQAGYFRKPSPECHEAVGMPPLASCEVFEATLDDAINA